MPRYLPRLRVSAYVICEDDDHVLLARWIGYTMPQWTLVGGGLDPGETPQVGALRELTEETGYVGELDALLGVDVQHFIGSDPAPEGYDGYDVHAVRIVYRGRVVGGELTHEVDGTTDLAAWIPRAEVPDLDAVSLVRAGMAMLDGSGSGVPVATSARPSPVILPGADVRTYVAAHGVQAAPGAPVVDAGELPGRVLNHGEDPADAVADLFREQAGRAVTVGPVQAVTSDVVEDTDGAAVWTVRIVHAVS